MSERLTITLSNENYKLLKDVSATTKYSMSKILNILTDVMLDKEGKNLYSVAILNRGSRTRLFLDNQEIQNIEYIEFKQRACDVKPVLNIKKVAINQGIVVHTEENVI